MIAKLMKGHVWKDHAKKMTYPCFAEEKVDEIRCDVRFEQTSGVGVIFQSYADKPLHNLRGFEQGFRNFMTAFDVSRLDMGVIVNRNFADTYRWVRSSKGIPEDLNGAAVEFILFDLPDLVDVPFLDRRFNRIRTAALMRDYQLPVFTPESTLIESAEDVIPLFEKVREKGGEGLMVKSLDHMYVAGKRSYGWLKVKSEEEADAVVVGVTEAVSEEGVPLGRVGSLQVECEDGSKASVHGIAHDLGRTWLERPDLIVGECIVFEYMEIDRQGGYRHPRLNRLREAKQ